MTQTVVALLPYPLKQGTGVLVLLYMKSVAYSSQGGHTGQLDFCNLLAYGSTTG